MNRELPPSPEHEPSKTSSVPRRRRKGAIFSAALAGGITLLSGQVEPKLPRSQSSAREMKHNPIVRQDIGLDALLGNNRTRTYFDQNPDYFRTLTIHGDYSEEERQRRTKTLSGNVTIFDDAGLLFFKVRPGDTLGKIRVDLGAMREFEYLRDQLHKLESFNIPARELQRGMWLPIPFENENRYITDEQFASYAASAIKKMENHEKYGAYTRSILKVISESDLLASLVAVAKQEAGGQPIGRYELHRWEPAHNVFSFSLYHILMKDAGLRARRTLNKSEGQLYHPEIATQLFIAYLQEKDIKPESIFPIDAHAENFAKQYNGKYWRKINPHYVHNLLKFYRQAQSMLATMGEGDAPEVTPEFEEPEALPTPSPTPDRVVGRMPEVHPRETPQAKPDRTPFTAWETIGHSNMTTALQDAHFRFMKHGNGTIFRNQKELHVAAKIVMKYLRRQYGDDTYYPTDRIGIGIDRLGAFMKVHTSRNGKTVEALLRIRR